MTQHIHAFHIQITILVIMASIVFYWCKEWLSEALSEWDPIAKIYRPSSLRLGGFIFVLGVFFWQSYDVLKSEKFDSTHLMYYLIMICLCWGIVKSTQLIDAYKGETNTDTTTVTKTDVSSVQVDKPKI